jgi:hypothetical protein
MNYIWLSWLIVGLARESFDRFCRDNGFAPVPCLARAEHQVTGMAKGDDALARKRNKVHRKRLRNSENVVSERVVAIISSKQRCKSGKRHDYEGMRCETVVRT